MVNVAQQLVNEQDSEVPYVMGSSEFAKNRYDFYVPQPSGWKLLVELYIRKDGMTHAMRADGTKSIIEMPEMVKEHDKWRTFVGLVIDQGPSAYKGEKYRYSGPWCKVGDWIIFSRNDGTKIDYRKIPLQFIPDDSVEGVVEDPAYVIID